MRGKRYYSDAAVLALCCLLPHLFSGSAQAVVSVLLCVIGTSVLLLAGKRLLYAAELLLAVTVCIVPDAAILLPQGLYAAVCCRQKLPGAAMAGVLIWSAAAADTPVELLCTAGLAVLLAMRTVELEHRSAELIRLRDNSTEQALLLQQKNKELLRKQDDEVSIATLRERNRIAREIHDNVGHLLSRGLLQSGALLAVTDKTKLPLQYEQTAALKETLTSAMNSIRESVHGLRDESIDLHRAVREAAEPVRTRFRVETSLDFSERMPGNVKLCFLAVVKEALSNAVKHSSGDEIHIIIREHPALYQLCVSDNGREAAVGAGSGMGLNNMRERVEALGGIFRISTGEGFQIFISVRREEAK